MQHYLKIENELRRMKDEYAPELSDEEFCKLIVIEHHTNECMLKYPEDYKEHPPYTVIRLKTPEEILGDIKRN